MAAAAGSEVMFEMLAGHVGMVRALAQTERRHRVDHRQSGIAPVDCAATEGAVTRASVSDCCACRGEEMPDAIFDQHSELRGLRQSRTVAAAAEQAGWDGLFVWDHIAHKRHPRPLETLGCC
jgi:hypothetical protein